MTPRREKRHKWVNTIRGRKKNSRIVRYLEISSAFGLTYARSVTLNIQSTASGFAWQTFYVIL